MPDETVCCDHCGHEYDRHIGDLCPNCGHDNNEQYEEKYGGECGGSDSRKLQTPSEEKAPIRDFLDDGRR